MPVPRTLKLQVRDALVHLHDLPYLQRHPLARAGGRALRTGLLEALEALRATDAQSGRVHRLLELRYVEGLTSRDVAARLGISQTEYYRSHQRGLAAVVSLIATHEAGRRRTPTDLAAPRFLTSFVGRDAEIAELAHLLSATRLLTLTGSGGCGKTRLALEVARRRASVAFADLAPLSDEAQIPLTVLTALRLVERSDATPTDLLVEHLQSRDALLVLDNCEHLVGGCARLVETILHACPRVRVLATSREILGVPGETAWRVPPLSTPGIDDDSTAAALGDYQAVRLFVDRARLVQPQFSLNDRNASFVARICTRLDGMPLAIELAAARLRVLPVEQIAARLHERFRLLTDDGRATMPRHRTLRAMVDWSHDMLAEPERALFRRLAVFVTGCSLEAAEAVAGCDPLAPGDVLDLMTRLVDKSLVGAEVHGGREHFRMLETIRQYAEEKLVAFGESETIRDRHCEWWMSQSQWITPGRIGIGGEIADGPERLTALKPMRDGLRAALTWCAASRERASVGLELARRAVHMWPSYTEQRRWIEMFLKLSPEWSETRGLALRYLSHALRWQGDLHEAESLAREGVAIFQALGDRREENRARASVALARASLGDHENALHELESCLSVAREVDDGEMVIQFTRDLGLVAIAANCYAVARNCLEESERLARTAGDALGLGASLLRLAVLDRLEGDLSSARARLEEARLTHPGAASPGLFTIWELVRVEAANLARATGRLDDAWSGLASVLRRVTEYGFETVRTELLCMLGMVEIDRGAVARGVKLLAAGDRGPGPPGTVHMPDIRVEAPGYLARARVALGEDAYAIARAQGRSMTVEQAIAYAMGDDD